MTTATAVVLTRGIAAIVLAYFAGAAVLAGRDGWGWLLLGALILGCVLYSDKQKEVA